jgi:hypothetical protein
MTISMDTRELTAALRRAAVRATLAPSVHNTQPWRFELHPNQLTLSADRSRQLQVLDPTGRQLTISCGCALFNARVALAASGLGVSVDRSAGDIDDVLARITATDRADDSIAALDRVIELRHTNRRRFATDEVPVEVLDSLERAALAEDSSLVPVRGEEQQLILARLSQRADAAQLLDPAYRAELRAWTSTDLERTDGVPTAAVPHVDGTAHDDIPIRDFDTSGLGALPAETESSRHQCLLLLCTRGDHPADWLRAGEALERVLLEVTRHGFVASPLTQVIEVAPVRALLRAELGLSGYPHVLIRVGRAPSTPATRRRRLLEVLAETR